MRRSFVWELISTCVVVPSALAINFWPDANLYWLGINQNFPIRRGVDVQGGSEVTLQAHFAPWVAPRDQSGLVQDALRVIIGHDCARDAIQGRDDWCGGGDIRLEQEALNRIAITLPGVHDPTWVFPLLRDDGLTGELPPLRSDLWNFAADSPPAAPSTPRMAADPQRSDR
ncbi:MAG: hypothetical protein M3Z04_10785 [Chloroflexota bacterium]|nr:hypothetical protein [Chloroflexota bacterium]